jgi:transcriptional regulator with XRE-family HTH domain
MIASKVRTLPFMSSAFGDRVKQAREAKGWSQSDLAGKVDVSRQAIFSIETGENKSMRPENLFKVADALEVKARWLATGDGPKTPELDKTISAETLRAAVMDVEKAIHKTTGKLTLEKKCELITAVYEMYISGEKPSNVVRLVQLASQNSGPLI